MRTTMTWMTICGWLVAAGAANVDAVEARLFNVLEYGAVGDDNTDNTAAF
jgi:hypothetical protein